MDTKEAFKIVLDNLSECNMFIGKFDARTKYSQHFMYGVQTVMENIAYNIDEETGDKFSDMMTRNIVASIDKAEDENADSD